ncbi:hypothetical protein A0H81_04849 [Grifola frondosa]|uniref:Uncharacterized protein n=1 Tax=Grifola frondosa TaxID=5627 RepID=A0A1C7MKN1_GRIFR|nr:hypothetical protein A0H81_04849 [Grifola frondosa]
MKPSLHPHPIIRPPNVPQTQSSAQTLFKQTRTLISRFVAHLAAPGTLRAPNVPAVARSLHTAPAHTRTIQQGFSFPAPHLPRAPAIPRTTTQVGLGTARNFSTGRPIFQNLVENVPISGRAFWEADWELKLAKERQRMRVEKYGKKAESKKGKEMQKPKEKKVKKLATTEESKEAELEHYFPAPAVPEVTTHLLIPLAATPTSRLPLPRHPMSASTRPLLPLELIANIHTSYGTHALRVSSLFARLDAARVFDDPAVHCETRGDPSGLCTLLEVRFEGWTASKVRGILGEAGSGWCVLEEEWSDKEQLEREEMEAVLENMSVDESASECGSACAPSISSSAVWSLDDVPTQASIDPAHSFVLPTIDFSASFPATSAWSSASPSMSLTSGMSTPLSDLDFHNAWSSFEERSDSFDAQSGISIDIDSTSWDSSVGAHPRSDSESWFGFAFSSQHTEAPREQLF